MTENGRPGGLADEPTWESARTTVPERPAIESNLPEEQRIPRPRAVPIALGLVIVGMLCLAAMIVLSVLGFDGIRDAVVDALPEDIADDYDGSDIERAANIMLIVLYAAGAVLACGQLLSVRTVLVRRSVIARTVFVIFTVLAIPVALLILIVGSGGPYDAPLIGGFLAASLVAAVLLCMPRVTRWSRQTEERRKIPLVRQAPDSTDASAPGSSSRSSARRSRTP